MNQLKPHMCRTHKHKLNLQENKKFTLEYKHFWLNDF